MTVSLSRVRISRGELSYFEATPEAGTEAKGTVVMVPGFTGSREDFLAMAPFVTAAGYRLISYSQLGQYDSDGPDGRNAVGEYTIAKFALDLAEVLDKVAPDEKVHLLGHSFGGLVTRAAVLNDPGRFLDYVILDSPPSGQNLGMAVDIGQIPKLLWAGGNEALWQAMFGAFEEIFPAPVKEFLRDRIMATKTANIAGIALTMSTEPDRVEELAATGLPILVAAGENDMIPVDVQADAAARLGVKFEIIAGAGHTPNEEKPEELTKVLVDFWNGVA
ncbi:pimeloyl-ACP methyl ester carboxylesterase [Mycobacterium frederiksbergense]|uniref:Pimeloyl-ACP methyl ester carboxylesterase n=1 Tax=Mycolicibacterium frederiksbergense TaxID=117567 RepID=A0ABT6KW19_9MYCO|nr:alpha/beta hydrolase [Mycolicibacterium frederiksbergense]MDH6194045.1 pimeloyl-ACP methyl ester carboxylesterase [Mycolicibacterium frederiksbergense]